jgi:hypothetical protein
LRGIVVGREKIVEGGGGKKGRDIWEEEEPLLPTPFGFLFFLIHNTT